MKSKSQPPVENNCADTLDTNSEIHPKFKWGDLDGAKLIKKWKMLMKKCFGGEISFTFNRKCKQELN